MRRLVFGVALVLAVAVSRVASGQSVADDDQARVYFQAGAQAYSRGQFAVAIEAFEKSWALSQRAGTLFSLAQTQRRQFVIDRDPAHLRRAAAGFQRYLDLVPDGGRRSEAADALVELEAFVARDPEAEPTEQPTLRPSRLMVTSGTPGAGVSVDGSASSPAPFIGPLPEGRHSLVVEAPGFVSSRRDVVVERGSLLALDMTLKEAPAQLDAKAAAGTQIFVDGRLEGVAPLRAPLRLTPGKHSVALLAAGVAPFVREAVLRAGETTLLQGEAKPSTQRLTAWTLFGVSAASVAAGASFMGLAFAQQSDAADLGEVRSARALTTGERNDYNLALERRAQWRGAAIGTFAGSAATALAGSLLFVLDAPSAENARPTGPVVSVSAASIQVDLRF